MTENSVSIRELQELVLVREEELRYATWKLEDARKRLQLAEAEEWAAEIERELEAKAALQAAPKPAARPVQVQSCNTEKTEDMEMADQNVKEEPNEPPSPVEVQDGHAPPVPPAPQGTKLTADVHTLVQSAMRAASKQQEGSQSSGKNTHVEEKSDNRLPTPPRPPPPEQVRSMCPVPCQCGEACTRVERMLRQQANTPFARRRLRHNNHTCDACQDTWIQRKRTYGRYW